MSIVFGDGGSMKSYLQLMIASVLASRGERVGYFDWELDEFTHRRRLEQITGPSMMPDVRYIRCDRPLVHAVDRVRRIIQHERFTYTFFDSVGYGTAGAPESAEAAMDYCRAVRQLGIGTNHSAHVSKSESGDQRPFGSTFWHNSARAIWNIKLANTSPDGQTLNLAAFDRKNNLGPKRPAVGVQVQFVDGDRVRFERVDAASIDEVADSLPLWQRIKAIVKSGPQTLAAIANELNHPNVDSVERAIRRHKGLFTKVPGGDGVTRIALVERRAS
jgi:hypothetical protein